ncbi:MAG: metallophosphoesterase [Ruminococcaceae bacterium]|nr:metallophosphoesterase [Oscillospiraceae bacterium]
MTEMFLLLGILLILTIPFVVLWIIRGNKTLETDFILINDGKIPLDFSGFKIAQISDLHDAEFGENNEQLLLQLKKTEADIIVITGDIIDSRRVDVKKALDFAKQAVAIAPIYYVNGNNESRVPDAYKELKSGLEAYGVTVLENSTVTLRKGISVISLTGISDPKFNKKIGPGWKRNPADIHIDAIPENKNYKILLAHRPEYIDYYAGNANLVFSGHAHGGQFILPFIGGILAPGQGFFPKYYDGLYEYGSTKMIVSRGLGNSSFPFRVNNKPVIVLTELNSVSRP